MSRKVVIDFGVTDRGFAKADFKDDNGNVCSIQKSSVATDDMIWLGQGEPTYVDGHALCRMHLSQAHVRALLPILQIFADTGELPEGTFVGRD